jgi:hypothetical protein
MKTFDKFSILVWICNLSLALLAVAIIACSYYYTLIPGMVNMGSGSEGVTKAAFRFSQSFLSDNYMFERVIDREKGINAENYYFASTRNLYELELADSVLINTNTVNELSSEDLGLGGLVTSNIVVTGPSASLPVRYAAPAVPLERDEFVSMARLSVLFTIISLLYLSLFIWFFRKFVSGLRTQSFFNQTNSRYLYTISGLVLLAPFLMWGWASRIRPDFFSDYQFANTTALESGSDLSVALMVFGIILLIIAWCFDQGVKLQKEQELTI